MVGGSGIGFGLRVEFPYFFPGGGVGGKQFETRRCAVQNAVDYDGLALHGEFPTGT